MNPTNNILRELFWDNPMTLEATRSLRRFFRAGMSGEGNIASSALNRFMLGALVLLYGFTIAGLINSKEDISQVILIFQAAILTLLVPGSLYGAIAVEREKQTYDALIMTRLTPAQIICGKYWWRVGLIAIVMAMFAPLLVITHFQQHSNYSHELTVLNVIWAEVATFTWSLLIGALSLWVSARSKKGITALLITFGLIALFLIGFPAITMLVFSTIPGSYTNNYETSPGIYLCGLMVSINPFYQLFVIDWTPGTLSGNDAWLRVWYNMDIRFWAVVFYAIGAVSLLGGAIKTVRGLEMPIMDRTRGGKRGR